MQIYLAPYTPNWVTLFEREKANILAACPSTVANIKHIGSTSVPGLAAKPIVDILVGIADFEKDAHTYVAQMTTAGYTYNNNYEHLMPYRRYFKFKDADGQQFHIHSVQIGGEFWQRHLTFRNYLRLFPAKRDAYYALKHRLAQQDWADTGDYADAKTPFIRAMEAEAKAYFEGAL